jgi:hypothetical protein
VSITNRVKLAKFKRLAADAGPLVSAVLAARVFAEAERERVRAYTLPIFQSYRFKVRPEWREKFPEELITDPEKLYLCNDDGADGDELRAYYAECDRAHRAHGFTGPEGHCPALTAEHLRSVAEQALIDLTAPFFEIAPDRLYGEHRAKFLELMIGASVQAGTVRNLFADASAGR